MTAGRTIAALTAFLPVCIHAGEQLHWAFQPVQAAAPPECQEAAVWARNPLDHFVHARLAEFHLSPAASARPAALLRRVFLDLTGLPPTLEEQEACLTNPTAEALDGVIDRLLASPAYGERWARHWLDAARYADSNGYERDAAKPFVWRYRDYVIRAFNADKPWDRFLTEQIAGDELPDACAETVIATGFLRLGHWDDEPADPDTDRFDQLDDIVCATSEACLGLTIGCARCHDHKFEPLSQKDYYSLLAVFAPLERPRDGRTEKTVPTGDSSAPEAYAWRETSASVAPTHVLLRGSVQKPGEAVSPAIPRVLAASCGEFAFPAPGERTTRRRLGLAQWITSPGNPLTARVVVNRVWQQHFGTGLVSTPGDFGLMGARPSHLPLLDWISHWFIHDAKWSLKKLHRLILTSAAWRQECGSFGRDETAALRPAMRRLEAEPIRDSILAVSGGLNRTMFGPPVFPAVPAGALEGSSDPGKVWPVSPDADNRRRSIYVAVKRSLALPLFETLDVADSVHSCPCRRTTTVAPQALTLFNGAFTAEEARRFAERIVREAGGSAEARITHAFRLALGRTPGAGEMEKMRQFLRSQPLEALCRAIFNLNEFVYPD